MILLLQGARGQRERDGGVRVMLSSLSNVQGIELAGTKVRQKCDLWSCHPSIVSTHTIDGKHAIDRSGRKEPPLQTNTSKDTTIAHCGLSLMKACVSKTHARTHARTLFLLVTPIHNRAAIRVVATSCLPVIEIGYRRESGEDGGRSDCERRRAAGRPAQGRDVQRDPG